VILRLGLAILAHIHVTYARQVSLAAWQIEGQLVNFAYLIRRSSINAMEILVMCALQAGGGARILRQRAPLVRLTQINILFAIFLH